MTTYEPTNESRARYARGVLVQYCTDTNDDPDTALRDLLADLMHMADEDGFDFDFELDSARRHHEAEVRGD